MLARRRGDDVDEATAAGLRLNTATVLPRWIMVEGAPRMAGRDLCDQLVCLEVPLPPYIKEQGGEADVQEEAR